MNNPLWTWSATALARGIAQGDVSSRQAVQASLDRMAQVNPGLNAIVGDMRASALQAADAADAAVARGDRLGPLHGVPVSIKANVDLRGEPNSNGVVAFAGNIAADDSAVVANLRQAGAVLVGQTNTPAFSMRWDTDNALHGRTRNPWSDQHTPGGSSGGASACVAAGMAPIAHGNDFAGSVRYPAYCTGLFGLRPSFGRVPSFNPSSTAERPFHLQLMSVQGPLARCVADIRLALAAMSQEDVRDPWWVPAPLAPAAASGPCRVALSTDPMGTGVHPHVAAALQRAASALQDAGYTVEPVDPPAMADAVAGWHALARGEAAQFLADAVQRHGDAAIRQCFEWHMGRDVPTPAQYRLALAGRAQQLRAWSLFLRDHPIVLCPVSLAPPFLHGADTASEDSFYDIVRSQAPCFAVPFLGLPALAAPTGLADGLPTGVQLIAARFDEGRLLDAAEVLEQRFPFAFPAV